MSNPFTKSERSRAKDARQSPANEKPLGKKGKKKNKPVILRAKFKRVPDWADEEHAFYYEPFVWGRYHTVENAEKVIQLQKLKSYDLYQFSLDGVNYA